MPKAAMARASKGKGIVGITKKITTWGSAHRVDTV